MLNFTETEKKIIEIIKEHADTLVPPATPRLAGGMIRDKLMNINSQDIDVTLDNISGYDFATGLLQKYNDLHIEKNKNVYKITANPEKSKHLETAVICLYGVFVDFTNLRSETYTDTRVPIIMVGTPLQDALRRDITINTLFYNIRKQELEDLTGKGLEDIKNRRIRTPMPPFNTFLDDPLRIIRVFRFKAKFDFEIDSEIYETLKDSKLGIALSKKVSKERIGIEIFKALRYEKGYLCIFEIAKSGFSKYVFKEEKNGGVNKEECAWFYTVWLRLINQIQKSGVITKDILKQNKSRDSFIIMGNEIEELRKEIENRREKLIVEGIHEDILWLYMVFHKYCGKKEEIFKNKENNCKNGKVNKLEYTNYLIMKENLKGSKSQCKSIKKIEESVEYIIKNKGKLDLVEMALYCSEYIFDALIICVVNENDVYYCELMKKVIDMGLHECYKTKPLVKGGDLCEVKGPEIKNILLKCLIYQIKNPEANKEKIIKFCFKKN